MGQEAAHSWKAKSRFTGQEGKARRSQVKGSLSEEALLPESRHESQIEALGADYSEGTFNRHAGHLSKLLHSGPPEGPQAVALLPILQKAYGNRYVNHLLGSIRRSAAEGVLLSTAPRPTPAPGQGPAEEEGVAREAGPATTAPDLAREAALRPAGASERGPAVGTLDASVVSRVFIDGGSTGTDTVWWAGGRGARGNQGVGSIQSEIRPVYEHAPAAGGGGRHRAWVREGTGVLEVERSYVSPREGANGNDWYITSGAHGRIETHEVGHVNQSRAYYDRHLAPIEAAVADCTGRAKAVEGESTEDCTRILDARIGWDAGVEEFRRNDRVCNTPGGTWDTQEQATADWYYDYGPRTVEEHSYAHYVDQRPGPGA
ncbi:MAG: hypothetical protein DRI40_08135 [Chloroflexi bacterium]|nr:MAG: hypothetical protein DRI40_08135 [Chloroflexota bacterium]